MVKDVEQDMDVFENDIDKYLQLFCEEQDIEDLTAVSQSKWNAALCYVCEHLFKHTDLLKAKTPIDGYVNNTYTDNHRHLNKSNCNRYDKDKVMHICNIYIYLCMLYDKEISVIGFCNLTNIENDTLYEWHKLSNTSYDVVEKIKIYREESLANKLLTAKNPIGIIAVLRRHYSGWDDKQPATVIHQVESKTAAELPRLDTPQNVVEEHSDIQDIVN